MWILLCGVVLAFLATECVSFDGVFACLALAMGAGVYLSVAGYSLPISLGVAAGASVVLLLVRAVIVMIRSSRRTIRST